ncbi:MAG: hypothetical protein AB7N70_10475 [Dehalococcoidia bacterium]
MARPGCRAGVQEDVVAMTKPVKEAALDEVLATALMGDVRFARWFLSKTPFGGEDARCVFCRSDHPWSSVTVDVTDSAIGQSGTVVRECETDVLAVFATPDGRRLGIHIENKISGGYFTPLQPELYQARKKQWKHRPKLGDYSEAVAVLVAPQEFLDRCREGATMFDARISHEAIAMALPEFAAALVTAGSTS